MARAKETLAIHPLKGYAVPIGYALACMETERERTRATVAGLSAHQLEAHVKGSPNSIGTLLYHIAAIELDWLYCEILEREIPEDFAALFPFEVRDEKGGLWSVTGLSLEDHLRRLDTVRQTLLADLKAMTSEDFYRLRRLEPYDVNPAWVLYHLLEHEAKHGDQMAHLRRTIS